MDLYAEKKLVTILMVFIVIILIIIVLLWYIKKQVTNLRCSRRNYLQPLEIERVHTSDTEYDTDITDLRITGQAPQIQQGFYSANVELGSEDIDNNFFILPLNQRRLPPSFYRFYQVDDVQEELELVEGQLTPPEKMEKVTGKSKRPRGSPIPEEIGDLDGSITEIVSPYKYWEKEFLI